MVIILRSLRALLARADDKPIVAVFSPSKVQGMIGGHGVGGAYSHIKGFGLSHSHIKGNSVLKACWADMP